MRKTTIALVAMCLVGSSHAILVDNFATAGGTSISSGTIVGTNAGPGIIGGERDREQVVLANPLGQFLDVSIGGGLHVVSNGFLMDSVVSLQYDGAGDEVGNTGVGNTLNHAGTGALAGAFAGDRVRIGWLGNDLKVDVRVELRKAGAVLSTNTVARAAMSGAGFQDIFMNSADMAMADSLTVRFHADPSGDFAIGRIETVPEPATMAALGLGLAAVSRRRRK